MLLIAKQREMWTVLRFACRAMQAILTHMRSCDMTEHCPFLHCQSSAQILDHWSYCVASNCTVCMPLMQKIQQISVENASGETKQVSNVLNVPNVPKVPNVSKKLKIASPPKMSLNDQQNVQASQVIKIKKLKKYFIKFCHIFFAATVRHLSAH